MKPTTNTTTLDHIRRVELRLSTLERDLMDRFRLYISTHARLRELRGELRDEMLDDAFPLGEDIRRVRSVLTREKSS